MVLYRLVTGKQPFAGPSTLSVLTAIAVDTPAAPRSLNPAVPEGVESLIVKLLEKKPENRLASAEAVAKELRALEAKRSAPPPTVSTSQPVPVPEPLAEPSIALSAVSTPSTVEKPAKKRGKGLLVGAIAGGLALLAVAGFIIIKVTNKDDPVAKGLEQSKSAADGQGKTVVIDLRPEMGPVAQPIGYALDFKFRTNPGTARVELPKVFKGNMPATVEMVVLARNSVDRESQLLFGAGGQFHLKQYGSKWVVGINGPANSGTVTIQSQEPVELNRVVTIAAVYTGKEIRLFVGGKLSGSAALPLPPLNNGLPLYFGGSPDHGPGWGYFDGTIQAFRYSQTARFDKDYNLVH